MKNLEINVIELCRRDRKMNTKDILIWLGIETEYDVADLGNAYLRVIGDGNLIEISEPKGDFDRWALSDGLLFDLNRPSERRAFLDFYEDVYFNTKTCEV